MLDLTSGVTVYVTGPGSTAGAAVVSVSAGFGQGVFPDFGRVEFGSVSVDRVALGRILSKVALDQVQGRRIIAETGAVTGGSFQVVQRSRCVPPTA